MLFFVIIWLYKYNPNDVSYIHIYIDAHNDTLDTLIPTEAVK